MKNFRIEMLLSLMVISIALSSCSVISGIFKAGMGVGIFIVIAVVVVIGFILMKVFRNKSK